MKSQHKAKCLQYFTKIRPNRGETWIELLVKLSIIGILAAIAIPSFLNQSQNARQAQAKYYLSALMRAQQAHYMESSEFASSIETLQLGIQPETSNYHMQIWYGSYAGPFQSREGRVFPPMRPDWREGVVMTAQSKRSGLKSYAGATYLDTSADYPIPLGVICETDKPSAVPPAPLFSKSSAGNLKVECPAGSLSQGR